MPIMASIMASSQFPCSVDPLYLFMIKTKRKKKRKEQEVGKRNDEKEK